jgi:hypothetical protein
MRTKVVAQALFIALASLVVLPAAARAQSSIAGTVKDTTGAVLPGVTVEASSPALIEKTRAVVSDTQGNYKIVDLSPGTYTLTFALAAFQTVRREGLELPSNFTMTVNGDLKVGSLEETLTVTGASPVVDVQTAAKAQVLNREVLDSVPTGRTIQGLGQLVTGITLSTPDVGGTRAMQQTYMSAHGMISSQDQQEPRPCDDGRLRFEPGVDRLDLAALHDRLGEVDLHAHQPAVARGRLFHELRALQHALSGRPRKTVPLA